VVVHAVSAAFSPDKDIKNSLYLVSERRCQGAFRPEPDMTQQKISRRASPRRHEVRDAGRRAAASYF
jgi:hypothetical protein